MAKYMTPMILEGVLTAKGGTESPATDTASRSIAFSVQTNNGEKDVTIPVRMFADSDGNIAYNGKPNPFSTVTLELVLGGGARGGAWVNGTKAIFGAPVTPTAEVQGQTLKVTIAA